MLWLVFWLVHSCFGRVVCASWRRAHLELLAAVVCSGDEPWFGAETDAPRAH